MPANYHIDPARKTVFMTITGAFGPEDAGEVLRRLRADPAFDPSYQELVDLTNAQLHDLFYQDLHHISSQLDPFLPGARRAIVAPAGLSYGISRMYQLLRESDTGLRVFSNMVAAREWLGVDGNSPAEGKKP